MRDIAYDTTQPLTVEVTSWYADHDPVTIPVISGSWRATDADGVTVPGEVEFLAPALDELRPITPTDPLASFGQRYRLRVGYGTDLVTWGWFRALRTQQQGHTLSCSGLGLLRDVERARLTRPLQTTASQTRAGALGDLLRGILPLAVEVDDQPLPVTTWEEDRIAAVWDVVNGWPARLVVDDSATAVVLPPWDDQNPGDPAVELVDGDGGTLVDLAPDGDPDEDPPNAYVVSTVPAGSEAPISEVWTMPTGPMAWGGPYGFNPAFFSSAANPTSRAKLRTIAERMTRAAAAAGTRFAFTALPDPRIEVGDVAHIRSARAGIDGVGRITGLAITRHGLTGTAVLL